METRPKKNRRYQGKEKEDQVMKNAQARISVIGLFTILALVLVGPGCAKKDQTVPGPDAVEVVEEEGVFSSGDASLGQEEGVEEQDVRGAGAAGAGLQDIPFEFDRHNLTPEARRIIRDDYAVLRRLSGPEVLVEGHCDNRGTVEYNLALGQRRAEAVRGYLISLGMSASSISTISYGEEMPLDPLNNEEAWALNRRAHIRILTR
jgi:peptidoglycan-associated lipoprotein